MNKKNKRYVLLVLFITFICNINVVHAKLNIEIFTNFSDMPKNYFNTLLLLGILFINLLLGLILGDNIVTNFNRIIKKQKVSKSLIIEIIILLSINITLAITDIQTFSLCIKALAASLLFGPILDSYLENKNKEKNINIYDKDLDNSIIRNKDRSISSESLKDFIFNSYKEIQKSYMYEDYDNLKKYVDNKLYKQYKKEIEKLHNKHNKRIIKNINLIKVNILDIKVKEGLETIDAYLNITKKDYISDTIKKKIIKGSKDIIHNIEYFITIKRNTKEVRCQHCNAPIEILKDKKCNYCDEKIIDNYNNFLITSKLYISKKKIKAKEK